MLLHTSTWQPAVVTFIFNHLIILSKVTCKWGAKQGNSWAKQSAMKRNVSLSLHVIRKTYRFYVHWKLQKSPWKQQQLKWAHLQYVGQIHSNTFHQHAVGPQLGTLLAGNVAVALANQHSHLFHGCASVNIVTHSLMDGWLSVVETINNKNLP